MESTYVPPDVMELTNDAPDDMATQIQIEPGTPFDKKWDLLKPVIQQLYIDEGKKLADVMETLRLRYNFIAEETQYKYHINRKWKMKKNITTSKKEAMCRIRQSRALVGRSTVFIEKQRGTNVEDKKLRRHLKETMRRDVVARRNVGDGAQELKILSGSSFLLGNSAFLNWYIPHGIFRSTTTRGGSLSVPSPMSISTPSDIMVATPPMNNANSPNDALSPFTRTQNFKGEVDRAYMFVTGRYDALVKSMNPEEKIIMSNWLHQFWLFGFKTAKYWGRGPRDWTAELMRLDLSQAISPAPLPGTPTSTDRTTSQSTLKSLPKPSSLCRWSIHCRIIAYEPCRSRTPSPDPDPDPTDESTWKPWPSSWSEPPYQARLHNSLESNDFSDIKSGSLPIAIPPIIKVLKESKDQEVVEALGFSIMAQNIDLLGELFSNLNRLPRLEREIAAGSFRTSNPLHLATTFVSGPRGCCQIVDHLLNPECNNLNFRLGDRNSLGHTVLDNLMIAILKAHTSILPSMVDDSLRDEKRFPGEEVDICGRWDADSDCIRALIDAGIPTIPFAWKHKFCHTSIQAINHCIAQFICYNEVLEDVNVGEIPSGLFQKLCVSCGRQMQLYPLHALVLTGFGLAQFGHKDEDLFGIVAILLSMLSAGMNPSSSANISMLALFSEEDSSTSACDHEELTPFKLAKRIPERFINKWPARVQVGWSVFCQVLWNAEREWETWDLPSPTKERHFISYRRHCFFGKGRALAKLWAAIQTELLTYRRLEEGDPWISPNFDMYAVLESLINNRPISVGLLDKEMMNRLNRCGCLSVPEGTKHIFPRREDVSKYYFSNLEDWSRTTFLEDCD